ncbi:MAG: hypothetical protein RLZZ238_617 [Planctomycetota bacterium]|jgi:endonuclease/exonuclease/phosphatase family metal-dependent hydrolase
MRRSSIALLAFAVCTLLAAAGEVGPDAPPIRIGSFNIRYANDGDGPNAWRHRSAMVLGILRSADFWGLQEALPGQIEDIRTGCAEFAVLARTRDADPATGEACPILYRADRWDLDADEHGTFWLSESPEVAGSKSWDSSLPRICTFARFRSKDGGRAFYLFNTHFDHRGSAARLEAARLLVKRIGARRHPDPVLVTGDLNCGPSSAPVKALLGEAAAGLRDAWRETNPDAPEQPSFNGWRDACEGDRIDWILVAGELDVESAAIDASKREGRWPSDHAFVRAEFVWRAPPAAE